ncbi:hypothetical protein JZ751_017860 [Albula glossodonta]|uniref:Uncharacterized protein n=1 Tax=Albula glossodonta TaxID=121402 RepID=A0A8T2PPK8_9TELE|nr:hypothetical protein JZ751_017860 [Albula glossodonta]
MNSIHANKMGSSRDRERSDDPKEKEHNKSGEVRSKRENKVEKRTSRKSKTPLRTVAFVPKFGGRFFRPYYKKEERFFQRPGHGFKLHRHHAATGVRFHRKGYTVPSGSPSQANQSDVKTGTHCTARTLEDQNDAQQTSKSTSRKKDVGSHSDTEGAAIHGKEIPLALKQTTMRSRAIQEKRREIEEVRKGTSFQHTKGLLEDRLFWGLKGL